MNDQDDEECLEEEQEALANKPKRGCGRPRGSGKVSWSRDKQVEGNNRLILP